MLSLAVVVLVRNGQDYLEEALESLWQQTDPRFRVVVYDDGSTDRTPEILRQCHDPRLTVMSQKARGVGATRQRALEELPEDLIAFLDSDDRAHPERVAKQRAEFEKNPDLILLGSQLQWIDSSGDVLGRRTYPTSHEVIVKRLPIENVFAQPSIMIRRKAALQAGGYVAHSDGAEDYDLWLRMAPLGRVGNLPDPLTQYRIHPGQYKASKTRQQIQASLRARSRAIRYGYRFSLTFGITWLAQAALIAFPPRWVYRLFTQRHIKPNRPDYDLRVRPMLETRQTLGAAFAQQILGTCAHQFSKPLSELNVLEIGCGYGWTSVELVKKCKSVLALEPCDEYFRSAQELFKTIPRLTVAPQSITEFCSSLQFDLIVLDNVYEHIADQRAALRSVVAHLAPGGVLFLLTPNRLWPIEVHYGLPFLSYLPLPLANFYLRITGRGKNYLDASHAPTYWGLKRALRTYSELNFEFRLPSDLSLTQTGASRLYRWGTFLLSRFPSLWAISKALLVVAKKSPKPREGHPA